MATYRTVAELANTTQDQLLPGIIDNLKKSDEFTAALIAGALVTDRPTIKFNRLASVGGAVYADCDSTLTSVAISASPVTFDLKTIVRPFDVCTIGQNLYSSYADVVATETIGATKGISETVASDAMNGNGTTAIAGIDTQNVNSLSAATSGVLTLDDVDALVDAMKSKGPNSVFVGAPAVVRAFTKALRGAAGGLTYDVLAGTAFKVPGYLGMPILRNEFAAAGKLYIVNLDEFKLYFGESPDNKIGGVFNLEEVGPLETKLAKRWRLYAHVAAVLHSTQGAAKLSI